MKAAVVYYSLEGHTRKVAQEVARQLDATLVELTCAKPYATSGPAKYGRASKDTLLGARPELVPYSFDDEAFDLVVLAAPCWAGRPAAPLNTFLADHDLAGVRRAAIITCKAASAVAKYGEVMRRTCSLGASDPVLALSEGDIADASELSAKVTTFCEACQK